VERNRGFAIIQSSTAGLGRTRAHSDAVLVVCAEHGHDLGLAEGLQTHDVEPAQPEVELASANRLNWI